MRRGARWALGLGAALVAAATVSAACADAVPLDVDECSTSCASLASDNEATLAGDITLSLFGGGQTGNPSGRPPDLTFDPQAVPSVLVNGPPSPIASLAAQTFDGLSVSPYTFFETVIDVPYAADARALTTVPFTSSLTSGLSAFLWASNDFFGPPSGDIADRRGLPLSVDADALTGRLTAGWKMRTPVTSTTTPSPLSAPLSSSVAEPFGQFGDAAARSAAFSSDGSGSSK